MEKQINELPADGAILARTKPSETLAGGLEAEGAGDSRTG